jgi:hypothetical protein
MAGKKKAPVEAEAKGDCRMQPDHRPYAWTALVVMIQSERGAEVNSCGASP